MDILDVLEERIDEAVEKIAKLERKITLLQDEKKDLEIVLAERELRIEGLQKNIEELREKTPHHVIEQYKERENQLRERIQSMLSKLNELKLLD
ncbi:MAG: cell division protein ZapB [Actinobacteria bacterium]|nr:cell division protein ZapB [Actinomycetota bacterium]